MNLALPALFTLALEAVSTPSLVHAGERVLYANAGMRRLLGYELEQLQAMHFDAWATEQTRDTLSAYGRRCLSDLGELASAEVEAITASGAIRYLDLSARRIVLDGRVLAVMTCQDLSDMRHVQTSLLDVGRVLHQIIENSPVATFVLNAEHRVTQWNAACAKLTGIEMIDLIMGGKEPWQAFYKEPRPLLADLIIEGREPSGGQFDEGDRCWASDLIPGAFEAERFFPQMGEHGRWLYLTSAPLTDMQGRVIGAIETLQDVTARRRSDEELHRHRQALEELVAERTAELLGMHHDIEAFLENASVGIITTSKQRITRSNKKFAEMFEFDGQNPLDHEATELFTSMDAYHSLREVAYPVLSRGESLIHEMEMCTLKGNRIWVQMIAYVADPMNTRLGTWWLLQDRTEVRRVQAELQENFEHVKEVNARLEEAQGQLLQSEKLASIGQLAAGVAHEINNPIGFVSSNLCSMRRYMESMLQLIGLYECMDVTLLPDELRSQIEQLRRQADFDFIHEDLPQLLSESDEGLTRVKKIVQDLKDFSRVDQSDWQDADLNAGIESTLNVVMNEVKYKAEIVKDYGKLPTVRCRAAQLNQVFMNLIVNAAHAIAERGVITLSSRQEGDWVCVSVRDTGCGMTDSTRRRIFEPFYTTKPVGRGTGLGLSLSFSIVKKHGGRIDVESEPGRGSVFSVWIPVSGPSDDVAA